MSALPDYAGYDAVGLADLVRRKQVSAAELLDAATARCDAINPSINAVVYRRDAEARSEASPLNADAPLSGVPFLVKDLGPPLANAPLTNGSRLFKDFVPAIDGEIVKRFKAAGVITFGKTNTPELGLVPFTEPELFGPCRNPWDLNRTPGGSSGGAAAAVAAGIVPMAHASDGGGSIRIPASCCGLFGLKPSRGLNPREVLTPSAIQEFVVDHVISRSVRDTAAMLDAISNQPQAGFQAGLQTPPGRLRIAIVRSAMLGSTVAPEVCTALDDAAKLLADLGHHVEDAEPSVDYLAMAMAFLTYWAVNAREVLDAAPQLLGKPVRRDDVEKATWMLAKVGGALRSEIASAAQISQTITKTFGEFLTRYDVLVSPTLAALPLKIGENATTGVEAVMMRAVENINSPWLMKRLLTQVAARSFAFAAFTAPFNMTGQPAISVPLSWSESGLPIGTQFAAKLGGDSMLLRLARQLEEARPWAARRPS